ncbi:glucans biosynthesis glucosyltransferase MdoH [Sphingomonas sp. MMS24-J13]|uniref:glucans biosynthesis glucosyltransferase MdoH n=1 Tax=Sphingomonas sp. MMS24-J13 TaxID=3238686 RepID=UPI0038510693
MTLVLTVAATAGILYLSNLLLVAQQMPDLTRHIYLVVYGIMTFFLAGNFFKLVLGTWHMLRGAEGNPWHPARTACDPPADTKVAILFPVYHEEVDRVAAGIAATWESIAQKHPRFAQHFDVFLLSDSRQPEYRVVEEAAVHALRELFPDARFFYRWRPTNQNAKMGNVADFCRRWGGDYDYMLVMDADSVMDGDAVVTLLRMMAGNDRLGILQTNPKPVLRTSLFGRMQQFGARLYGSVFSYGLQAMYMGNASYIGHNAIIRMAPFVRHCMLPELTGPKPWGGKPLSHDIVESAMMARAGYEVWFLADMEGSYEEMPANLLAFLIRERRWMQGNLQHLRFVFLRGLRSIHRETFINGSMGYFAAPLWAVFLVVSAYGMLHFLRYGVLALGSLRTIEMPMLMLLISSLVFLFMPRVLAILIHIRSDKARLFGGKDKLIWSVLLETLFSFFFSPLMMVYISRFLWMWLKRKGISWGTQQRGDEPLPWDQCVRHFGWISAIGVACLLGMIYQITQVPWTQQVLLSAMSGGMVRPTDLILWFAPIIGGFTASIWIARVTSLTFPSVARRNLFAIPEEIETPDVVKALTMWDEHFRAMLPDVTDPTRAIAEVLRDPGFYVRHRRETRVRPRVWETLGRKIQTGVRLKAAELQLALSERRCFDALHVASLGKI